MAGSINKVILLGRLGADPEIRVSQDGNKIARFSIATSESWKDKNTNEKKDKTEWHKIVIFSPGLADVVEKYLKKGALVYVEGQIRYRKYTDQAGIEKFITEIALQGYNSNLTMLDNKLNNENIGEISSPSIESSGSSKIGSQSFESVELDDEVPF